MCITKVIRVCRMTLLVWPAEMELQTNNHRQYIERRYGVNRHINKENMDRYQGPPQYIYITIYIYIYICKWNQMNFHKITLCTVELLTIRAGRKAGPASPLAHGPLPALHIHRWNLCHLASMLHRLLELWALKIEHTMDCFLMFFAWPYGFHRSIFDNFWLFAVPRGEKTKVLPQLIPSKVCVCCVVACSRSWRDVISKLQTPSERKIPRFW